MDPAESLTCLIGKGEKNELVGYLLLGLENSEEQRQDSPKLGNSIRLDQTE